MNLETAPRLPKWIFFAIDAGLLTTAFIIIFFNDKNPYAPVPLICAVLCVMLAAVVGLVPFLVDYAADSAEYVQKERVRADEQVQRLHTAGESLARAAAQIKAVEEAVHKTAHTAENLPYRMQEKLAEFNAALAQKEEGDQESLEQELADLRAANSEQLRAVADKIQKAAADWATLEAATRKQFTAAEASLAKIQNAATDTAAKFEARLSAALAALDGKLARVESAPATVPAPATPAHPAAVPTASSAPESIPASPAPVETSKPKTAAEPSLFVESVAVIDSTTPSENPVALPDEAKAKKPRLPRKSKPEETLAAMSEPSTSLDEGAQSETFIGSNGSHTNEVSASARSENFRTESSESAASSDGATRLLATAYIGIGNKLFIRGEGPGLSWEKGVPMQFVSIGKWGWATNDATGPVRCELYKNDETAALTGEVILDPGKHVEITALF